MITLKRTQHGIFEVGTETNRMGFQSLSMAFYAIGALQRVGIKKHGVLLPAALIRSLAVKHEPSKYHGIPLSTFDVAVQSLMDKIGVTMSIEEDYVPLTLANCALLIIFGALLLVLMQSGLHMVQHVIDVHPY